MSIEFNKNVKDRLLVVAFQATEEEAKAFNAEVKAKLRELVGTLNTSSKYEALQSPLEDKEIIVDEDEDRKALLVFSNANWFGAYNFNRPEDEDEDNPISFSAIVTELGKKYKAKASTLVCKPSYKYVVKEL